MECSGSSVLALSQAASKNMTMRLRVVLLLLCLLDSTAAFVTVPAAGTQLRRPVINGGKCFAGMPLRQASKTDVRVCERRIRSQATCALQMNLFDIAEAMNPLASRTDQVKKFFRKMYDMIDIDKSGSLDKAELAAAIEKLAKAVDGIEQLPFSEKQVTETWLAVCGLLDANHDGKLDFDEAWGMFVRVCGGDLILEGTLRLMPLQVAWMHSSARAHTHATTHSQHRQASRCSACTSAVCL